MKQIGARQEAGRIGGIGPCGRELCCSCWMTNFVSVSTSCARCQDLSINPQKLAGQCGKLKCCLNYEIDAYVEAQKNLPSYEIVLQTKDADYYHVKTDIFQGLLTYSADKYNPVHLVTISKDRVFEVINMNKKGEKPLKLEPDIEENVQNEALYTNDLLNDQNIDRFDDKISSSSVKKKKKKKKRKQNKKSAKTNTENSSDNPDKNE